ncbi:MAG TPA: GNAT family N-acetyltransferase [Candidatus Methylomirabilis sp.]|nr:GNAT family N-acetyltransferase [Candidatus Methylomirabilis sp.]
MEVRPMAVTERSLIEYPQLWKLEDGTEVTVRPMVKEDRDKLADFFRRIPIQELRVLKDDVTDVAVIDQWARTLDYDRVLPLVVEVSGRIIADATLHRRRQGWRRHLGGVRVVVDPEFRHRGLASRLLAELAEVAAREGLVRLYVELPADDKPALELFRARGFKEVAGFKDQILDLKGKFHDLVVLHMDLVYRD